MKRFLLLPALLLIGALGYAETVWISSYTATADTTKVLCGSPTYSTNKRAFLHSVCVSSPTAAASTFIVYNASGSATNIVASIDATGRGCYTYDVSISTINKGMTYSNSSTASVEVMYQCY